MRTNVFAYAITRRISNEISSAFHRLSRYAEWNFPDKNVMSLFSTLQKRDQYKRTSVMFFKTFFKFTVIHLYKLYIFNVFFSLN